MAYTRRYSHQQGLNEGRCPIAGTAVYVPPLPDHDGDDFRDLRDDAPGPQTQPNPTENEHGSAGPNNPTLPF